MANTSSTASPASLLPTDESVVVGVCVMAKKANGQPMKNMIERLGQYFKIVVFPEEMILKQPVDRWPSVQVLIAFYSDGYPLQKVQEYAQLRKPWALNDLEIQRDLLSRTKVYEMLAKAGVAIPRYAVVWRDDMHPKTNVLEEDDQIVINDQVFKKPFVEKPVSAEDHNIVVYFPTSIGGGSQQLFRKTKERSSQFSTNGKIRREGSYVYEEFLQTNGIDVKVYAVGPYNAYAEARKAPSLDGKVDRNESGKEKRYPVTLTTKEKEIARQIVQTFKQTVCGFDLLRSSDGISYVCDVNGFSFVKASTKYYDHTAKILRDMIRQRYPGTSPSETTTGEIKRSLVPTTTGTDMELRCVLAVFRHGDRTPKQKMKMTVDHARWTELFEKYRRPGTSEVKMKKPEQLQAVLDTARNLFGQEREKLNEQTFEKLTQLKSVLEMYGTFSGINRKIQLKRRDDSSTELNLTAKWGGELTEAGLIQAEATGKRFRNLYAPSDPAGTGFLRLHNTYRHDLKIYASDEGRVQMTAAAFTKGLLAMDTEPAAMLVHMVKSADTDGLLDDDKETRKFQETVKKRLKDFFQLNRKLTEQDMAEINPLRFASMNKALHQIGNPRHQCETVWELASELCKEIDRRCKDPQTKNEKLYEGESWTLVGHRWQKHVKEFRQKENGQIVYEISKIKEIYDSVKYDLEHNVKHFRSSCMNRLYDNAKLLADVIVPQEYGIEKDEKLMIGRGTCTPLMKKLSYDLRASCFDCEDGNATSLDAEASEGIESPSRRVRTRLYFAHKSQVHSLMNVIRHGDLIGAEDEQWKRATDFLSKVWEYNYLSQVVILLFEDNSKHPKADERYHVELHFSPGVLPYAGVDHLADEFASLGASAESDPKRLFSTDVVITDGKEEFDHPSLPTTAVIGTGSASPGLWSARKPPQNPQDVTCYLPPLHALTTLSNRLTYEKMNDFFSRMTQDMHPSELYSTSAAYFANRSFAYIKTECYGYALNDANKAIELDRSFIKAYHHRAAAYLALGKFKLALKDYELVHKAAPSDVDARNKFQECGVERIAFEKAVSVQHNEQSVAELIDLETMAIEDDYKGPSLVNGQVTLEFVKELMETFRNQGHLHKKFAYKILFDIKKFFMQQPSMVDITVPPGKKFTICGDVHGQFYDLLRIFELNGIPSEDNPFLFNGDFVDRGSFSVETIFTLFSFKLLYPNHFFMSRGNHESKVMNQLYGFEGEVKSKYSAQMAELFTEVFNWLPLCHLINSKILAMHGGLFSNDDVTLEELRKIERNRQPPEEGPMCDLLWSDPQPQNGRSISKRGVGTQFGPDVTQRFCSKYGLQYVVRSHEVKPEGYEVEHDGQCITVFSAPNYCDVMGNKGAFLVINGSDLTPIFTTYEAVEHPKVRAMAYANSVFNLF